MEYESAKKLFFDNSGSYMTMKKNGEFKKYRKLNVPEYLELQWKYEIRDNLVSSIRSGESLTEIYSLSRVDLSEEEIIEAFKILRSSPLQEEIKKTIDVLQPLIDVDMYEKIVRVWVE